MKESFVYSLFGNLELIRNWFPWTCRLICGIVELATERPVC